MRPEHLFLRELATKNYLRNRRRIRIIVSVVIAILVASIVAGYAGLFGDPWDDWSRFNHHSFDVIAINQDDSLVIASSGKTLGAVELIGVVTMTQSHHWLIDHALGKRATLLLQVPQTRNAARHLLAFVYVDNQNISVELTKAGLAYADRRSSSDMDGVIDPAESEARKKSRGLWANLKFDQMPAWRQVWLKSFTRRATIGK